MDRDLAEVDYVYVGAGGIHLNVRLEKAKTCVLVLVGVRADGSKELVALKDGYHGSAESWAGLVRDCAHRGMRAAILAVGEGATKVLDAMPKSAQPGAKKATQDLCNAEDK
jgi:transposase-like protein